MRVFGAIGHLMPITAVVIAHVPQILRGEDSPARPYGSVFVRNSARVTWELRQGMKEPNAMRLGLFQTKNNLGLRHDPIGYTIGFSPAGITISPSEVADDPDLVKHLPAVERVYAAIRAGAKTSEEIKDVSGARDATIQAACVRLEQQGRILKISQGGEEPSWVVLPR